MKVKNLFVIIILFMILLCCVNGISAVSDDIVNDTISEIDSGNESISVSNDEQLADVDDSVPVAQENDVQEVSEVDEPNDDLLAAQYEDGNEHVDDYNNEILNVQNVENITDVNDSDSVLAAGQNDDNITGQPLKFNIEKKAYNIKINKNDIVKLSLENLTKCTYKIISYINSITKTYYIKVLTFIAILIQNNHNENCPVRSNTTVNATFTVKSNTTFIKGQNDSFKVALTANGIALSNRPVTVTLNNNVYIKITDNNGTISVPINLTEGNYTIKYSYNGDKKIQPTTGSTTIQVKRPANKIPVLVFHRIMPDDVKNALYQDNEWVASESVFADMMKYIYDNNYNVISIEEFNEWYDGKKEYPENTIVITIDDGYLTDYAIAYPILKKYNFKFTSFIIGSKVKEKTIDCNYTTIEDYKKYPYAFMGKDIIDKMHEEYPNWSFQGHSYNLHYSKDGTAAINLKTPDELKEDFEKLSEMFEFNILAYPYGVHNDNAKKILNETGYTLAFRFGPPKYATRNDDRYAVSRVKINSYMNVDDLAKWLTV